MILDGGWLDRASQVLANQSYSVGGREIELSECSLSVWWANTDPAIT